MSYDGFVTYKGEMVVRSGLTSNTLQGFIEAIQTLSKAFDSPPKLDGKSFQWEPLVIAA